MRAQTFKSFQYPVFRLFFTAMLSHRVSINMQMIVRSLLIYRLTGSAAILGMMSFAHMLPMVFMSLYGGAIADRYQKKHIIMIGEIISALVAVGVGIALTVGYLSPEHGGSFWVLIAAAIVQGLVNGLARPSQQAIIPEIVGEDHLLNAVSLNAMSMNVMRTLAPAAAGFLVDSIGFNAVYFTMAVMYSISVLFVSFMPHTSAPDSRTHNTVEEIKEGIRYIRKDTIILSVLLITLVGVVLSMPYMMLMPIFADDILKVGATGLGFMMSAAGVGAIVGSLILASIPNKKKRGFMLLTSSLFMGLALLAFSFSNSWYLSLGMMALVGFGHTARMSLSKAILYNYTETEYRGRVMSVYMMEIGLISFAAFTAGLLTEAVGVQWALGSFSLVLVFLASLALVFLVRIRNVD